MNLYAVLHGVVTFCDYFLASFFVFTCGALTLYTQDDGGSAERRTDASMFRMRLSPEAKAYAETALVTVVGVIMSYTVIFKILTILL